RRFSVCELALGGRFRGLCGFSIELGSFELALRFTPLFLCDLLVRNRRRRGRLGYRRRKRRRRLGRFRCGGSRRPKPAHIASHFQASEEFGIAGFSASGGQRDAMSLVPRRKIRPLPLQLLTDGLFAFHALLKRISLV